MPFDRFRRHFLPWDGPWLPQVAAWLAREWDGTGPLDLSHVLAVVPTRQSGRRLREALAEFASGRAPAGGRNRLDAAVFSPRTQTPDTLLASGSAGPDVATRLEALLAWAEVLRGIELEGVPDVFPVPPPRRDFGWAWQLAQAFFRLQTQLTEAGLGFGDVVARAGPEFAEAERWQQLAELERLQVEKLAAIGKREPHAARRAFAAAPSLPPGTTHVVVLASPDPIPLSVEVLHRWAAAVPVDIVIHAPPAELDAFDAAGRPVPVAWERRVLALPEFEQRVHLCPDPAGEAERAAKVARHYREPEGVVAFGLADPEVLPLLDNELSRAGLPSYNPEGRLRRQERLFALLSALATLGREPTFEAMAALARCPDFLSALQVRFGAAFSAARFLAALDDLRARHLPADLVAARAAARDASGSPGELLAGLEFIEQLHATVAQDDFPANAIAVLRLVFTDRRFQLSDEHDARMADAADAWREVMSACVAARPAFAELRAGDWWDIALALFAETRRTEEKPPGAVDLQGWLELLWEDAPHLIVAGLNDGLVPDAIVGDPFLPESLRERLGLKSNAARFARDAYLLQAIAAARSHAGRLDLLFAKTSAAGDPLRPSRLLLRCEDADLPARIAFLFRTVESARPSLPWTRAWQLAPRRVAPPARVPVTGLRTWLECPFRFYLRHVLRMEAIDPAKSELDERDFGTLCHTALEAMAREPALRDCTDEAVLREFLLGEFDRAARRRLGDKLTLPLVVQLESARQRLAKVAALQAREREAGWVTERVEWGFALVVAGLEVRGKIDRIDRHERSGAYRVIDYKTSDAGKAPHKAHLRVFRAGDERLPHWMRLELNGRDYVWADLQLPIYVRAISADGLAADAIAAGYINLPKAVGETGLALWPELTPALLASAHACTEGVAAAIRAGEFWPPAEVSAERDAFSALFHHGSEDSIDWTDAAPVAPAAGQRARLPDELWSAAAP